MYTISVYHVINHFYLSLQRSKFCLCTRYCGKIFMTMFYHYYTLLLSNVNIIVYKVQMQFLRISNNSLESIDSAFLFFDESLLSTLFTSF